MDQEQLQQQYQDLKRRAERSNTEVAKLQGIQAERQRTKAQLEQELKAAGVDVANLDAEEKRLQAEQAATLVEIEGLVTSLERDVATAQELAK